MTTTIGTLLAAHAAGKSLMATVEETYARIKKHNDPALFIAIRPKSEALAIAERMRASGSEGKPLYGVPFAVKDNIDVAGLPTTASCPAFTYQPEKSAFVVEKLERAGAIVIGKTNLDQFATGLVGVRSPYGVPRNALRADLIPGGSSSGSAAAVGAGLIPFSLGTDTAGSGRVPAAFNGIVGLKPSLGALSTSGVVPACRTLDTISIFAHDVGDAFMVYQEACAFDEQDAYSRSFPSPALSSFPSGFRLGVPRPDQRQFFDDSDASAAFSRDLQLIESLGARIVEFDFEPFAEVARALYEGPWVAERYAATKPLIESNPDALLPVTRAIIEGARKFDAVAAFEAFYRLADQKRKTSRVWSEFDAMVVPTAPRLYTIAEVEADSIRLNSRLGTYTNFVNLLDLCAIAVPSGTRGDGLPSSVTLIAPARADGVIAGVAAAIESRSGASASAPPQTSLRATDTRIEIAVVGAHLSGLPLNRELIELSASFSREVETTPEYRLFALPGSSPPKPGLLRVGEGDGAAIKAEVWTLDPAGFGAFVAKIPAPLGIGTIRFKDSDSVKGFLVEAEAVKTAEDISHFGGWRAYLKSR
ncbi:MAG TPA: allophanate hydrolase [Roseiarcus sp.]|jgi:allophanate hydrolase|nr:allophanate hydrolase [Roseiarcus sp.]